VWARERVGARTCVRARAAACATSPDSKHELYPTAAGQQLQARAAGQVAQTVCVCTGICWREGLLNVPWHVALARCSSTLHNGVVHNVMAHHMRACSYPLESQDRTWAPYRVLDKREWLSRAWACVLVL